jgi:hypothetical protein
MTKPTAYTLPNGMKAKNAPANWPFGRVKPPSKAQMQRDALKNAEPAPF